MNRSERLLKLLQILHRHRFPVSGQQLADELGISIRTLYRDIASLQAQGADIEGEAGVGYILRPGFLLPPLMFSTVELEALMLGIRWVKRYGDKELEDAGSDALAKLSAVLPQELQTELEHNSLLAGPREEVPQESIAPGEIRRAIREQRKISIRYVDHKHKESQRTIWPFALGYFDKARIVVGWCEKRNDFRHFRTDRIKSLKLLEEKYPRHRSSLLKEWRALQTELPETLIEGY